MSMNASLFLWVLGSLLLPVQAGRVVFSDGRILEGEVRLTEGKKLAVLDLKTSRRHQLDLEEVARIDTVPAYERMEKIWRFKEAGSPEKVKIEETYPLRTYQSFVTLKNGTVFAGAAVGVFYVRTGNDDQERFILLKRQKGIPGQTLDDLLYVRSMDFTGGKVPPPEEIERFVENRKKIGTVMDSGGMGTWRLQGSIPGAMRIIALDRVRQEVFQVDAKRKKGDYVFEGLRPGSLDLLIRYPDRIESGLASSPAKEEGLKPLKDIIRAERDFFEEKKILNVSISENEALALVEMEKTGTATTAKKRGEMGLKRIYAYFLAQSAAGSWHVKNRFLLFRIKGGWDKKAPDIPVIFKQELMGIEVGSSDPEGRPVPLDERIRRFDYTPSPAKDKEQQGS